jgi:hypothetical protein
LHCVAEIPLPPERWVAHWYSLLGGRRLVGRRAELNLLTDWVAHLSSDAYSARLLALVAIGGMGQTYPWWNPRRPPIHDGDHRRIGRDRHEKALAALVDGVRTGPRQRRQRASQNRADVKILAMVDAASGLAGELRARPCRR